jgi:tetratricopeptide (TPR) repeat protein
MQDISEKLMSLKSTDKDTSRSNFSAIFRTTSTGITAPSTQIRIGMWPAISDDSPAEAMGLMTLLAMLLEQWQSITVYRLFTKLEGNPEDYTWDISQSQFELEDWHPETLDDNAGMWGSLQKTDDRWIFTIEVESDLSNDDETFSISETTSGFNGLVNWLPEAANEIAAYFQLSTEINPAYATDKDRDEREVAALLQDLFHWELQLLLALWGKGDGILQGYLRLTQNDWRYSDDFAIWSLAGAVSRTLLPGYAEILGQLPPLEDLVRLFDNNPIAGNPLGLALYRNGHPGRAVELLEQVLTQSPDNAGCWNTLAAMYRQSGDMLNAVDTYQRAVEAEAVSIPLLLNYAQLLPFMEGAGYVVDEFVFIDPDELNGDYMTWEAIEAYTEALKHTPKSPTSILASQALLLIDVVETKEHFERLWNTFKSLVSYDGEGEYTRQVIEGFYNLDDTSTGLEILEDAVEQNPHRVDLRINLALAYIASGEADYALDELEQAYELTDDQPLLGEIERLMLVAGDPDFETKISEISDKINAGSIPDLDELEFLEATLENAPQYLDPYLLLARTHILREETADALETLLDAQKRFPQDPDILELLGAVLWETGEYETALNYLQQGLTVAPDHIPLLARMGQCLFEEDDRENARLYLSRAEALDPRHPAFIRARNYIARELSEEN